MVRSVAETEHSRHLFPARHNPRCQMRIGLMGGSFNPAHDGHLEISDKARKAANLDEIWWLVSPQNPLKPRADMAELSARITGARALSAPYRWLRILDIEHQIGVVHTAPLLSYLKHRLPVCSLFWIMGADNLTQFPYWQQPRRLSRLCPVIVVNRPGYGYAALGSEGAAILGRGRRRLNGATLGRHRPGWSFLFGSHNPLSASQIRKTGQIEVI